MTGVLCIALHVPDILALAVLFLSLLMLECWMMDDCNLGTGHALHPALHCAVYF